MSREAVLLMDKLETENTDTQRGVSRAMHRCTRELSLYGVVNRGDDKAAELEAAIYAYVLACREPR